MMSFEQCDEIRKYFTEGRLADDAQVQLQFYDVEGITLQIEKKAETAGAFNAYIYLIMDAQLNIQSGTYVSATY